MRQNPLIAGKRISVVLGGGGMKGFAHIGVLRAIEEAGITPSCFPSGSTTRTSGTRIR